MNLFTNAANTIDINVIDVIQEAENANYQRVADMFNEAVSNLKTLIANTGSILSIASSQGKDSSCITLAGIEAYRQLINENVIDKSHPLIISTVDTQGEALPMKFFVRYAKKRLEQYAKDNGISLYYDIVTPPLNDEYFVRFVGGQKLIANSSRSGDCSVILKINPAQKYIKGLQERFAKTPELMKYASARIITCVGSRNSESARRSANMNKQRISHKTIADIEAEISSEKLGKTDYHAYAPIRDWSTDDVFSLLLMAGAKPVNRIAGINIPAYLESFGLLVTIYGNGSNETCEIAVGAKSNNAGCNGKARFGCVFCTMVGATDKSNSALSELKRWSVLGSDSALRLRDYMFRLSASMDARAFHARAIDPAGFNRVVLQPNIIKPKHLEKIVRYAAQITLDAKRIAAEFKKLVSEGREMEHAGYREIAEDIYLAPRTKKEFLAMYRECAQDPTALNYLFTEEHAILLSFRWALDGIGSPTYRPLAILKQLERGEGWIPYPDLNTEYEAKHGPLKLIDGVLPEAILMPVLKKEDPKEFAQNPFDLLTLWQRPLDISDINDEDRNCSIVRRATHLASLEINYQHDVKAVLCALEKSDIVVELQGKSTGIKLSVGSPEITGAKLEGKALKAASIQVLTKGGVLESLNSHIELTIERIIDTLFTSALGDTCEAVLANVNTLIADAFGSCTLKLNVNHLQRKSLFTGYGEMGRNALPAINFTKRVTKVNRGKFTRANTRLGFYSIEQNSRLHRAHVQETSFLVPDFESYTQKFISTHSTELNDDADMMDTENIIISQKGLEQWRSIGGVEQALAEHDAQLANIIKKRHIRKHKAHEVRQFGGTTAAEHMLAQGVITIEPKYFNQLQRILRRTQIFDQMGLFCFQSMKHSMLVAHPNAITMAKHRSDKAAVLSFVRQTRNAQRKTIREALEQIATGKRSALLGDINRNTELLVTTAKTAARKMISQLASSLFHIEFNTHDVGVKEQARVSSLWFSMYLDDISKADDVLAAVTNAAQLRELKTSPVDYLAATRIATAKAKDMATFIEDELAAWDVTLAALRQLHKDCESGVEQEPLSRYNRIISDTGADAGTSWFNPSVKSLTKMLACNLEIVDGYVNQLQEIQDGLHTVAKSGVRALSRQMSLADKMALIANRQAA